MLILMASLALAGDPTLAGHYQIDQSQLEMEAVHGQAVQSALDGLPWALREFARRPVRRVIYNCGTLGIELTDAVLTLGCDDKADKVLQRAADGHTTLLGYGEQVEVQLTLTPSVLSVEMERSEGTVTTEYRVDGDHLQVVKSVASHWLAEPVTWQAEYHRVAIP